MELLDSEIHLRNGSVVVLDNLLLIHVAVSHNSSAICPAMHPPLAALIQALLAPGRYPDPAPRVELVQTHSSWVLLADDYAYKIKKPVTLPFLDFATPAQLRERILARGKKVHDSSATLAVLDRQVVWIEALDESESRHLLKPGSELDS